MSGIHFGHIDASKSFFGSGHLSLRDRGREPTHYVAPWEVLLAPRSVREGLSFSQIIQDYYPDLETEDIRACIQYAIDVVAVEDSRLATTQ